MATLFYRYNGPEVRRGCSPQQDDVGGSKSSGSRGRHRPTSTVRHRVIDGPNFSHTLQTISSNSQRNKVGFMLIHARGVYVTESTQARAWVSRVPQVQGAKIHPSENPLVKICRRWLGEVSSRAEENEGTAMSIGVVPSRGAEVVIQTTAAV